MSFAAIAALFSRRRKDNENYGPEIANFFGGKTSGTVRAFKLSHLKEDMQYEHNGK